MKESKDDWQAIFRWTVLLVMLVVIGLKLSHITKLLENIQP